MNYFGYSTILIDIIFHHNTRVVKNTFAFQDR
jgi:hypothetical protein